MYEEDEQSPSNILPALKRYKWHLIVSIPLLLIIAVVVVLAIPPVYRSTGTVMVETQQIPSSLVQSTVTNAASEQIEIITQRVMTREKLAGIVGAHEYFGYHVADQFGQSRILSEFRDNVDIRVTSAKSGRETVAIGFSVSYDSDSPGVAQAMARSLTKLFLDENVKARTERASETTDFLRTEADKIKIQLEKTEAEVAEFKRKNKDALPEHLNLYMGMREDARRNLSGVNESITAVKDQISILQNQLSLSKQQGVVVGSEAQSELTALKQDYNRLLLQYQPDHPDVVLLKDKIALLEGSSGQGQNNDLNTEVQRNLQSQISSLQAKLRYLEEDKQEVNEKLADLEQRIIKIPQVERDFTSINRNYQTILEQYQSLQAKAQSAAMAESLEHEQKAERFTLLEAPFLPTQPYKPDRKKLLVVAVGAAMGLPVAIVFLLGFLDRSIRSAEALTKIVGTGPLVEIPYITTRAEEEAARKQLLYGVAAAVGFVVFGLLIIHLMVMPLDVFLGKVVTRIGI
ncbi:GumC family protein [Ketobacter sp.]|uniref:GumC family protein n=1 Tax=Ketobacter sp. TaxID=2083498 RepID=UPI000F1D775C|nr:Wzz/FepE/Etk N-terminal domain-containing protein [Ketobacter sp.]RLT93665.1 MAG: hypothetical protein D9N14_18080 [Ketobacter sp.]